MSLVACVLIWLLSFSILFWRFTLITLKTIPNVLPFHQEICNENFKKKG